MTKPPITEQHLVLQVPGMRRVFVERDIPFGADACVPLAMDVYRPAHKPRSALPAVVFVTGYSDVGARETFGCNLKDWAAYVDWARLVASRGLAAITYCNVDPVRDVHVLIDHVTTHAERLGVDASRLGLWSCSGNVPTALAAVQAHRNLACAALLYGYLLDAPGRDDVASAAAHFGFANAAAGFEIGDLSAVPLMLVRAGRDEMPALNASLDRFVARALEADLPVTVMNHAHAAHAFDVSDRSPEAVRAVRQILAFLEARLACPP